MKPHKSISILAGALILLSSCRPESTVSRYLFLGHPYSWEGDGNRVDARIGRLPLGEYDQIWLGGDVCSKTTEKRETLYYLDSLFRFESGKVHWAWGNHDVMYGQEDWLAETTRRPEYYAAWVDGMLLVVLNTNLLQWPEADPPEDFCKRMEGQYEMLRAVSDTVRAASHVVILHHMCLLSDEMAGNRFGLDTIFNFYKPFLKMRCRGEALTFSQAVYPLLTNIRQRGIPVVLAGGDLGMRSKEFAWQTPEGIWFLGSGINNSVNPAYAPDYVTDFGPDKVLEFTLDQRSGALNWKFVELGER